MIILKEAAQGKIKVECKNFDFELERGGENADNEKKSNIFLFEIRW